MNFAALSPPTHLAENNLKKKTENFPKISFLADFFLSGIRGYPPPSPLNGKNCKVVFDGVPNPCSLSKFVFLNGNCHQQLHPSQIFATWGNLGKA